jgi:hypothetical protein
MGIARRPFTEAAGKHRGAHRPIRLRHPRRIQGNSGKPVRDGHHAARRDAGENLLARRSGTAAPSRSAALLTVENRDGSPHGKVEIRQTGLPSRQANPGRSGGGEKSAPSATDRHVDGYPDAATGVRFEVALSPAGRIPVRNL